MTSYEISIFIHKDKPSTLPQNENVTRL